VKTRRPNFSLFSKNRKNSAFTITTLNFKKIEVSLRYENVEAKEVFLLLGMKKLILHNSPMVDDQASKQ
jgi:hypothetical protein